MTEQEEYKPKWLLELESRKRKVHLGHETGAGAPCLSCESACPGLDLHFWRKICKNCKCRGDDHDFDDDEFPQFELLFGPNAKSKKKNRSVLLPVTDSSNSSSTKKTQTQPETPFEWVPPDTTKELAADYMKALPSEKLPITGSAGAALRRQQLQKQLPLHDIDHKACDGLSEEERREFEKYLDNLKRCAGQGKVSKLMTIRPFDASLMTPANATDVQRSSPQHSQELPKHHHHHPNGGPNLRTPSSFIPKGLASAPTHYRYQQQDPTSAPIELAHSRNPSTLLAEEDHARGTAHEPQSSTVNVGEPVLPGIEVIRAQQSQTAGESSARLGRYHHALANVSGDASLAQASGVPGTYHSGSIGQEYAPNNVGDDLAAEAHRLERMRIGNESSTEHSSDLPVNKARLAEQILSKALLPPSAANAGDIVGSSLDEQGLAHIRGKLSDKYSGKNDQQQQQQQQTAMASRDLEQDTTTPTASLPASGAAAAAAMIASSDDIKRSAEIARELESQPASEMDVSERNRLHQHYMAKGRAAAKATGRPTEYQTSLPIQSSLVRSEALNNPVFPEEAIGGASTAYQNPEHIDQMRNEQQGKAASSWKVRECYRCQDDIYPGQVVVTADKIKDAVWHPGCFKCCDCNELLVDLVYFTYKGRLYCGRDLAKLLEIPRCHACDELIFTREYTVAEGLNYHVKHFCCWDCDTPLANQLYVMEENRPLCLPCYQRYYAKTCNACNNVIAADQQGVAIKNLNFHASSDCFCCVTCKKSLHGGQIAIKENRLLCSKECIAEFLHRRKMGR